jgi:hypothetical protein
MPTVTSSPTGKRLWSRTAARSAAVRVVDTSSTCASGPLPIAGSRIMRRSNAYVLWHHAQRDAHGVRSGANASKARAPFASRSGPNHESKYGCGYQPGRAIHQPKGRRISSPLGSPSRTPTYSCSARAPMVRVTR